MTSRFKFLAASFSYLSAIFIRRDVCEDDIGAQFEQQPTVYEHDKRTENGNGMCLKGRRVPLPTPEKKDQYKNGPQREILSQLKTFINEIEEKASSSRDIKLRTEGPCASTSVSAGYSNDFEVCERGESCTGHNQSSNLHDDGDDGIHEIFRKELTDHSPIRNLTITTEVYSSSDYEEFESDTDYEEGNDLEAANLNASLSKPSNFDISRLLELRNRGRISRWGNHPYRHRIRLNRNLRDQPRTRGNVVNDGNEAIYLRSPAANPPLAELLRNAEDAQDFLNGQGDNDERENCIQNLYNGLRSQPEHIVISVNFSSPMKLMTFFLAINTFILLKVVFWEYFLMLF